eukprot:gene8646-9885_t
MVVPRGAVAPAAVLLVLVRGASAHGWITHPMSRVELVTHHYKDGMPDDDL